MFKKLLKWSSEQHSHLPWRENRSLYLTLVSEIMLQQTTVQTVVNHIDRFLKKYPTLQSLAQSNEEEVCIAWKGLGYYRRARNLLSAAQDIQLNYDGKIPTDIDTLKSIKGIGEYTANAIIAIGAGKRALAVDANLERVIARIYAIDIEKGVKLQKEIYKRFHSGQILKELTDNNSRELNEAFMDLGRVICQARKVECILCPVKKNCLSFERGLVDTIPKVVEKKKEKHELDLLRVIVRKRGKILGYTKSDKEWLQGQVELPTFILKSTDKEIKQYPNAPKVISIETSSLPKIKSSITKYKITNYILEIKEKDFKGTFREDKRYHFVKEDVDSINFTSTVIKILKK
ncbi:A/G-specific adenine glycosylase [Halobacteriovorax marinus]|uniref:A/G-specific adenine glycosylase n=1 Tax=Halobacteriovorax marinus TaxID=97084 RepID=UPI003A953015